MFNKIAILSVGLMGGSLAAALKQRGLAQHIVGWGYRKASLETALTMNIIDEWTLDLAEAVAGAEIIVVCSPSKVAEQVLCDVIAQADKSSCITDVASVKAHLQQALIRQYQGVPNNVVLAHPIAGSEQSGVKAANADLYQNQNIIVTPNDATAPEALAKINAMWQAVGGQIEIMAVEEHDQILAGTSHLPHLLAFNMVGALAHLPASVDVFKFAAGGLRDFTRIAASDPQMWAEIALVNKEAILAMLAMFQTELTALTDEIEQHDSNALMTRFSDAKASRDHFSELLIQRQSQED